MFRTAEPGRMQSVYTSYTNAHPYIYLSIHPSIYLLSIPPSIYLSTSTHPSPLFLCRSLTLPLSCSLPPSLLFDGGVCCSKVQSWADTYLALEPRRPVGGSCDQMPRSRVPRCLAWGSRAFWRRSRAIHMFIHTSIRRKHMYIHMCINNIYIYAYKYAMKKSMLYAMCYIMPCK